MAETDPNDDIDPRDEETTAAMEAIGQTGEVLDAPAALYEPPFWQQAWVQNALPLATSILIHSAIIVLGLATYSAYQQFAEVVEEQVIVPDAAFVEGGEIGGIPNPGLGGDPTRAAAQDEFKNVSAASDGWADKPSDTLAASLAGGGSGDAGTESVIGLGPGSGFGSGTGAGSGVGSGMGSGDGGGGGALAPFGVPGGGGGIGPKAPFMGVGGNARNVVFVCDASGSMMGMPWELLKRELNKAVSVLKPVQAYNIIFFQESGADAFSQTLEMGNPDNKTKTVDFLKGVTLGSDSNPLPGLDLAFRNKPQLIYLLTDGAFPDNDAVKTKIRNLNKDKSVKVNTIAFFRSDQNDSTRAACEGVLRSIAEENGGLFKVVTVNDLMAR